MSGLLTTDREGRITSFNPEAERITGRSAASALGRDVEAVLPGIRRHRARRSTRARSQSRVRTPYTSERGERLHLGLGAYLLKDAEGVPSGHVVIFQDVTQVVEMERELRRSERLAAIGQLSASIAHEVRNPLAAISGSIQVLGRRTPALADDPEARRLMEIVLRETDRLNALITDFLAVRAPGAAARERDRAGASGGRACCACSSRCGPAGVSVSRRGSSPGSGCARTRSSCARCSGTWC